MWCGQKLRLKMVDSEALEPAMMASDPATYHQAWHEVCTAQGILVPGKQNPPILYANSHSKGVQLMNLVNADTSQAASEAEAQKA
jgi:hypothetical protein